nr:hypothetical protein [Tanacetum cinerariifolium]
MTTPTVTLSTDSQIHNNIMASSSKDRPPKLLTGRYPQWRSRFLRYIDTRPNGDALRKCILNGPYIPTTVIVQAVAATNDSPAISEHTIVETPMNIKFTSHDGETMESYYTRFYKLMNEMIRNNLTVTTMQVNFQFLQQIQPEWSRFVTIVKQQHKLDKVSYPKLFDILKQYQKEVNDLCAERLARNANPLALVATAQANQDPYYQRSKYQKSYAPSSKPSIPTRSYTTTRYKCKDIAKLITPPSESDFEEDNDPKKLRGIRICRRIWLLLQSTSKGSTNLPTTTSELPQTQETRMQSGIQCFNCKEFGHFAMECRKPKRVKDSAYHKDKMLLCKQAKKSVPLQAENNKCFVEMDDSNVIPDSPNMCDDDIQNDQNDIESDDERVALANLIANLKLDVDENKKIQKQLKKANTTLAQELKEYKTILAKTSKTLGESNSVRDSFLVALQNKPTEFEKYKAFNDCNVDYDKLEYQFHAPTAKDMDILIHTCLMPLALKTQNGSFIFVHELKQDMQADLKYVESLEKEIDELESDKAEFSNTYDMILQEYKVGSQTNVSEGLSKPITAQTLPQTATQAHRSNQMKDKVVINNSQVKLKKTQVEDHPRILSISNKIKSVTACNDSLDSKTSNVNDVCATCGKILVDSDHFACVIKMLNDVNARTKKPNVVPINTIKPKGHVNKYVATPHKKKVASKTTTQKPKSYYRMLYVKTSKAWKWWIEQQCPSGYKWVPKTKMQWDLKLGMKMCRKELIVQLILFIVDSGCTKHMTGNLKLFCNFVEKFMGTVRFGNDQFAPILEYGDLVQGNIMINRVYYVEGLNYNLFSVGQFCDADLEVAFWKSTCFVRDLQGNDLLTASPTQAWLWHRRLSHLNFDYINLLSKKDVVIGLPKLKFVKDQLFSSCKVSKAKRSSFKLKAVPSSKGRLNLLHMDLCGLMRVASINGKKYILVIVDDYSRYTWTLFLRSKDETPEMLK